VIIFLCIIQLLVYVMKTVCEMCTLVEFCAAYNGAFVPTFRDNLSIPSSRVWTACPLMMGPIGCPETSVRNYHSTLIKIPQERRTNLHRVGSLKSRKILSVYCEALRNFCIGIIYIKISVLRAK
jgi:hypothetical protein